ncbi:GxxExxY protein [Sorangium sp. So ce887]|uniref:GxxExxY protein n=1 Tax=Sorangium sp. So ce887 TaxID=3133324 RepID=UPI003F5DB178
MSIDGAQRDRETRRLWELSERVIGACIEVHRHLGPGLLASVYEQCLCHELSLMGLSFARQRSLPVTYKRAMLDCGYRLDVVVEERLILELKAVDHLLPVHEAQVLTYLKLTDLDVGLLVNFNTPVLRRGIRRLVRRGAEAVRFSRCRTEDDHPGTTSRPASMPPEAVSAEPAGSND